MKAADIIKHGGFERGDTRSEALGKLADLVVKVENAKLVEEEVIETDAGGPSDPRE